MDGGVEQTLPPALRGLPVARVFVVLLHNFALVGVPSPGG